ncbi:hypothetical protein [Peristeroidobacter soli]|uniref:hypothetical protein n=1 Tax=Peristeroidobacter soli TaxID=2497877 RepID=UPI00158DD4CA|nr:hypothetical protein [Peristeroidobacter soli]
MPELTRGAQDVLPGLLTEGPGVFSRVEWCREPLWAATRGDRVESACHAIQPPWPGPRAHAFFILFF